MAINTVAFHLDPNMTSEQQAESTKIAQRRAIAQAMSQQAMSPSPEPTVPGAKLSPLAPIAKIAEALAGGYGQRKAEARQRDLVASSNADTASAVKDYMGKMTAAPAVPAGDGSREDGYVAPAIPAGAAPSNDQKLAAIKEAMGSKNPLLRHLAGLDYAHQEKFSDPYKLGPGESRVEDNKIVITAPDHSNKDKSIPADWEKHLPAGGKKGPTPGTYIASDGDTMQMNFEGGQLVGTHNVNTNPRQYNISPPAVTMATIIDPKDPSKSLAVDARLFNKTKYLAGDNTGVLGDSPKEGDAAKRNNKQSFAMQGLGQSLQKAEDLLMGNKRDSEGNVTTGNLPTGSTLGSLVDKAGGLVGLNPTGAEEATQLKVVGGVLTSKVPRFEGPQSDKDTLQYRQMAGQAGDDTLPRERRLAAVRTMREIFSGYEDGSRGKLLAEQTSSGAPRTPQGAPSSGKSDVRSKADAILGK